MHVNTHTRSLIVHLLCISDPSVLLWHQTCGADLSAAARLKNSDKPGEKELHGTHSLCYTEGLQPTAPTAVLQEGDVTEKKGKSSAEKTSLADRT